jgi:hypothetical protein
MHNPGREHRVSAGFWLGSPLQRHVHGGAVLVGGERDGVVQAVLVPVDPLHVLAQAPRKVEHLLPRLASGAAGKVARVDGHLAVEEGQLAQAGADGVEVKGGRLLEHFGVGLEQDPGPRSGGSIGRELVGLQSGHLPGLPS